MQPRGFDPEKLLSFSIPEIRQDWTRADTVLYNLSVGLGFDPLSENELPYVALSRDLKTLPSMATVMAHPGFWLENPESGADPRSAVHGEQEVVLHRVLPAEGRIVSQSRICRLVDKGEGRDATFETYTDLIDANTDSSIATLRRITVLRRCGGFGGDKDGRSAPPAKPQTPPDWVIDRKTLPQQALLYALNGDSNPLHVDPEAARQAGFPRPILHGLCTFGALQLPLITCLAEGAPERLRSVSLRFSSPLFPGETVRISIWSSGAFEATATERNEVVVRSGLCTLH